MSILKEHDEHIANELCARFHVVNVSSWLGEIEILECEDCGYIVATCMHTESTWKVVNKKSVLLCNLCEEDITQC